MSNISDARTPLQKRNDFLGPRIAKALENRHFEAWYFPASAEAVDKILTLIPEGDIVSWGGSETIRQIGLTRRIHEGPYNALDRDTAADAAEKIKMSRDALLCDTYLSSVNAINEDGIMVNIDGNGNRVAAIAFGPKQVILVIGMNKVVKTHEDAIARARNYASPVNVQRFGLSTPCATTGSCSHCKSTDCICSYIVSMRNCRPAGRIKVVLIGEELGF